MERGRAELIEAAVDAGAATLFAAALAIALIQLAGTAALACAAAALGWFACFYALRAIEPVAEWLAMPAFEAPEFPPAAPDELVLTMAERVADNDAEQRVGDELLLDPAKVHFGADSRVVRLFAPAAMQSPGELNAGIGRHPGGTPRNAPGDASQALFEALAELRRSLR